MKSTTVLSIVASAALMTGIAARADDPPPPYDAGQFAALGLNADQQKRLDDLRDAADRKVFEARQQLFRKGGELRQLWAAKNPDAKAIRAKQAEMDQLRRQIETARTDYHLAAFEVLTPAQREKVQAAGGPGFGPGRRFGRGMGAGGPGWRGGCGRGMGGWGPGRGRGMGGWGGGCGQGSGYCGMGPRWAIE